MTAWMLTWLWQGLAIALSLSFALRFLPRVNAATRYLLWWGVLLALLFLGWQSFPMTTFSVANAAAGVAETSREHGRAILVRPLPAWGLSMLVTIWACVGFIRLLRVVPGVCALSRLKGECQVLPQDVASRLTMWQARRGRRVRLALCDKVPGAAVLGLHDPCIVLPSSLVNALCADDLDRVILHEYGHVQRRDDWMRLLQTILESVLWPHPAIYLIGRGLNLEREVACDDWVIARMGSAEDYARCLSRVAHSRRIASPAFAQALFGSRRDLLRRVDRLLDGKRNVRRTVSLPAAALGSVVLAACAVQLYGFPLVRELRENALPLPVLKEGGTPAAATALGVVPTPVAVHDTLSLRRRKPETMAPRESQASENVVEPGPEETVEKVALVPETPTLAPSKIFEGVYETTKGRQDRFSGVADAGKGVGDAAQRAGVSVATAFSGLGASIARRF